MPRRRPAAAPAGSTGCGSAEPREPGARDRSMNVSRLMNISFTAARRLGVWTLVAIVVAGAVFMVVTLRSVVTEVHTTIDLQEVKERHFTQMATRFALLILPALICLQS